MTAHTICAMLGRKCQKCCAQSAESRTQPQQIVSRERETDIAVCSPQLMRPECAGCTHRSAVVRTVFLLIILRRYEGVHLRYGSDRDHATERHCHSSQNSHPGSRRHAASEVRSVRLCIGLSGTPSIAAACLRKHSVTASAMSVSMPMEPSTRT